MNPEQARQTLASLIERYVSSEVERQKLLSLVHDETLPRVPVKGVLSRIDQLQARTFTSEDERLVAELVFFYL